MNRQTGKPTPPGFGSSSIRQLKPTKHTKVTKRKEREQKRWLTRGVSVDVGVNLFAVRVFGVFRGRQLLFPGSWFRWAILESFRLPMNRPLESALQGHDEA